MPPGSLVRSRQSATGSQARLTGPAPELERMRERQAERPFRLAAIRLGGLVTLIFLGYGGLRGRRGGCRLPAPAALHPGSAHRTQWLGCAR